VAGAAVLVGGYLAGGVAVLRSGPLTCASLVTALVVAAVNAVNDRQDASVDAFDKPNRPLPSGRMSMSAAGRLVLVLVVASSMLSLTLGFRLAAVPGVQLALGLAYCYRLKDTVLIGNVVVAVLFGSTITFGALTAGRLTTAAIVATLVVAQFLLGFEVLKTVADIDGDARSGLRTVATVWGMQASLLIHRAITLVFIAAALLPWPLGLASAQYELAILVSAVLPAAAVVLQLRRSPTTGSIRTSIRVLRASWLPGLLAMLLLR
jgi:geranylgeranylglycerol-phosphate geranylgeranyltransferase